MWANAIDEDVEVAETDEWFQVSVGRSYGADVVEDTLKTSCLPFPPPPPPPNPQKSYTQVFIFEFDAHFFEEFLLLMRL